MLSIVAMRQPRLIAPSTSLSNADARVATGDEPPNRPTAADAANTSAALASINEGRRLVPRAQAVTFGGRALFAATALPKSRRSRPSGGARAFASTELRIHLARPTGAGSSRQLATPLERYRPQYAPFASSRRLVATTEQAVQRSMSRLIIREPLLFSRIQTPLLEAKRP